MKKILILLLLVFSVFLESVYGQDYQTFKKELEQIRSRSWFIIGPFSIMPPVLSFGVGYDNNVYLQHEKDDPVSDYTANFSFQIKVYLPFRNSFFLSLMVNPEYIYYHEEERERGWNNIISPELRFLFLRRFVFSGSYTYINRRWRASSEFDQRANERRESFKGSLFFETPRRTSIGFSALLEEISYEDVMLPDEEIHLSQQLNREERNGYFEFYYKVFSESFIFIKGGYSEYNFEDPLSQWRDSYSYQINGGIRFPLMGKTRGLISLGYENFVPRSEEKKGFSGLIGNTRLDFKLWRFNLSIYFNRDNEFSYWSESIFFTENRIGAGISFYLTRSLRLDYAYAYGNTYYPESIILSLPDGSLEEIEREDEYNYHKAGLVIRILRRTGLGLMVNFWKRESNYFLVNRERMYISSYITFEF